MEPNCPDELKLEILRLYIFGAVLDSQDHDPVVIGAIINAAVSVRQAAQTFGNMVARGSGEIHLGDPRDLGSQVGQELLRVVGAALGNIAPNVPQILNRGRSDNQAFRFDGPSFRS